MSTPTLVSRFGATLAAVALLALLAVAGAAPSHAHDELVSTDPAAGSTLPGLPAQLTLTFRRDLLADPRATLVQVTDASGTPLTDGDPMVAATTVTQPLTPIAGSPGGEVTVLWRVVSSDGHPISDSFTFGVPEATIPPPAPTPTPTASLAPVGPASATPSDSTAATPLPAASDSRGAFPGAWIVLGIVVLGAAAAMVYLLVSRGRRDRRGAAGGPPANDSGTGSGTSGDR